VSPSLVPTKGCVPEPSLVPTKGCVPEPSSANEFGKGNFQYRILNRRKDELGILSQAFNRVGEELQRYSQQITSAITQRNETELAAAEWREYLESALSQCPSGIVIANACNGLIRFINQAALEILDLKEHDSAQSDAALCLDELKFFLPDGAVCPREQLPLTRAMSHGEFVRDAEFMIRNSRAGITWVCANAAPIRDDSGHIIAATLLLQDVTERRNMIQKIEAAAYQDTLTALANRASILRSIQNSIERQDGNHFALLFMDFDRFKLINDSLGHEMGDELLRQIARRIQGALRATDRVAIPARLGGDEFVVLLDDLPSVEESHAVAERLLDVLSQSYDLDGQTVCSTASIGVVTSEHPFESAIAMLRDADLAMYKSKADGKGRYTVFDDSLRFKVQQRLVLENDMRAGIDRNEFILDYQPIFSLETGRIVGAEALARWMHPQHGLLGATEFIDIADETGMIVPIGDRFINDACRMLACWQQTSNSPRQPLSVHVNLSRLQLLLPNLLSVVEESLAEHSVPAECLHLEVRENVILQDPERVVARLIALRKMGVKIDIDGFGVGFSSLSCLHEFPIDFVKIDRSFIANAQESPESLVLLTAVLNLADQLGLQVVAAGIENVEQVGILRQFGCQYGQGYLFARPIPGEEVARLVSTPFIALPGGLATPSVMTETPHEITSVEPSRSH